METSPKFQKKCGLIFSICISAFLAVSPSANADTASTSSAVPDPQTAALLSTLDSTNQDATKIGSDMGMLNTDALLHTLTFFSYVTSYYTVLFPSYLKPLTDFVNSWLDTKDNSGIFANTQGLFATLWNDFNSTTSQQLNFSKTLTTNFLIAGSPSKSLPAFANELSYSTVIGAPLFQPSGQNGGNLVDAAAQNFITNASGSNILLTQASPDWAPSDAATQYKNLYKTLAAIQSYDSYLISGLYSQNEKTKTEDSLTAQASSPDWFSTIASESLGLVLRQILMFTSQQYVQTQRLIELQRQQLAVSAMTNVLLGVVTQGAVGSQLQNDAGQAKN